MNENFRQPSNSNETENNIPSTFRVAVRVRPILDSEKLAGMQSCLRFETPEDSNNDKKQLIVGEKTRFAFNYLFEPDSTQSQIYGSLVSPLTEKWGSGFNSTIFAYGATGSGKTYTIGSGTLVGKPEIEAGIIPRFANHVFGMKTDDSISYKVSFIEIYNEELRDLLNYKIEPQKIQIRELPKGEIQIIGIKEIEVTNATQLLSCALSGIANRATATTLVSEHSSRSHAIFTVTRTHQNIIDRSEEKEQALEIIRSKFCLVDLAGSERQRRSGAEGVRFTEAIHINRGLLALGNVISALCENRKHIPYRDSKLTRILKDSLGGNSLTLMIACISPALTDMAEVLNTIKYAARAKHIKNIPIINRDIQSQQRQQLRDLKEEIANLNEQLYQIKKQPEAENIIPQSNENLITGIKRVNYCLETIRSAEKGKTETKDKILKLRKEFEEASSNGEIPKTIALEEQIKKYQQDYIEQKKSIITGNVALEQEIKNVLSNAPQESKPQSLINAVSSDKNPLNQILQEKENEIFKLNSRIYELNEELSKDDFIFEQKIKENSILKNAVENLEQQIKQLESRIKKNVYEKKEAISDGWRLATRNIASEQEEMDLVRHEEHTNSAIFDESSHLNLSAVGFIETEEAKISKIRGDISEMEREKARLSAEKLRGESQLQELESLVFAQNQAFVESRSKMQRVMDDLHSSTIRKEDFVTNLKNELSGSELKKKSLESSIKECKSNIDKFKNQLNDPSDIRNSHKQTNRIEISRLQSILQENFKNLQQIESRILHKIQEDEDLHRLKRLELELQQKLDNESKQNDEEIFSRNRQISALKRESKDLGMKIEYLNSEIDKMKCQLQPQSNRPLTAIPSYSNDSVRSRQYTLLHRAVNKFIKDRSLVNEIKDEKKLRDSAIQQRDKLVKAKQSIQLKSLRSSLELQKHSNTLKKQINLIEKGINKNQSELLRASHSIFIDNSLLNDLKQNMEDLTNKREKLIKELGSLSKPTEVSQLSSEEETNLKEISDQIESLDEQILYLNQRINSILSNNDAEKINSDENFISQISNVVLPDNKSAVNEMTTKFIQLTIQNEEQKTAYMKEISSLKLQISLLERKYEELNQISEIRLSDKEKELNKLQNENQITISKLNEKIQFLEKKHPNIRPSTSIGINSNKNIDKMSQIISKQQQWIEQFDRDQGYYRSANKELREQIRALLNRGEEYQREIERLTQILASFPT